MRADEVLISGMSACLQRFQWRSQRADLRSLHEPGQPDRKGMGCWTGLSAARYRAGRDRGHRGRRPGLAGLAGIGAGAIRGARPGDMVTAPGWRADRAWLSRRGTLASSPGELPPGASRQSRDLTAPVPVRYCPAL